MFIIEVFSYVDGVIVFLYKEWGMVDCVIGEMCVWDGKIFIFSLKYSIGMCWEIILGGIWMLLIFVSQVIFR